MDINGTHAEKIETDISFGFDSDSIWVLLWIALLSSVIIVIIFVVIKASILLFRKTNYADYEDSKDSPNILRMAVAGSNNCLRDSPPPAAAAEIPLTVLERQRPVSSGSVNIPQQPQPGPNSTRPCCCGGHTGNNATRLPNPLSSSGGITYAYKNPFGALDTQAGVAGVCYVNMIR